MHLVVAILKLEGCDCILCTALLIGMEQELLVLFLVKTNCHLTVKLQTQAKADQNGTSLWEG
jgi:hypothetical protein